MAMKLLEPTRNGVAEAPPLGANPHPIVVCLDALKVDLSTGKRDGGYARPLSEIRVQRLVDNWDPRNVGRILLSRRTNGDLIIIDGQHRAVAARRVGVLELPADVFVGLTRKDEAELYLGHNDFYDQQRLSRFWAKVACGDARALSLLTAVEGVGLRIASDYTASHRQAAKGIVAIVTLEKLHHDFGSTPLHTSLKLMRSIWTGDNPRDHVAYQGVFLNAWVLFTMRYREVWDEDEMLARFRAQAPIAITRGAKGKMAESTLKPVDAYGMTLVGIYNEHRRTRKLQGWFDTREIVRKAVLKAREERRQLES